MITSIESGRIKLLLGDHKLVDRHETDNRRYRLGGIILPDKQCKFRDARRLFWLNHDHGVIEDWGVAETSKC